MKCILDCILLIIKGFGDVSFPINYSWEQFHLLEKMCNYTVIIHILKARFLIQKIDEKQIHKKVRYLLRENRGIQRTHILLHPENDTLGVEQKGKRNTKNHPVIESQEVRFRIVASTAVVRFRF